MLEAQQVFCTASHEICNDVWQNDSNMLFHGVQLAIAIGSTLISKRRLGLAMLATQRWSSSLIGKIITVLTHL